MKFENEIMKSEENKYIFYQNHFILNPFADPRKKMIHDKLVNMGYNSYSVFSLLVVYEISSMVEALELLQITEIGWLHIFIPSQASNDICTICGDNQLKHIQQGETYEQIIFQKSFLEKIKIEQNVLHNGPRNNFILSQDQKYGLDIPFQQQSKNNISKSINCEICFETISKNKSFSLSCGHCFCKDCIKQYLENIIYSGRVTYEMPSSEL